MSARAQAAALAVALFALLFGVTIALARLSPLAPRSLALTGASLFALDRVWTVELSFTADAWTAMEPAGGGPFGRGGRGGPPPGGPAAGGRGPASGIAASLFAEADADGNGRVSKDELVAGAGRWFGTLAGRGGAPLTREALSAALGRRAGAGRPPDGEGPPPAASGYPQVNADLTFDGRLLPSVVVRYKGNSSFAEARDSLKRSFKVDLNDGGFDGRKLGGATKLNLNNEVADAGWMSEALSYRLYRDAGVPAPRTAYARVYVTVPGVHARRYFGLYTLVENVDNPFARDRFGTKKGALFKPTTRRLFEDEGDRWESYARAYDPKTPVSADETGRVIDFAKLVSHAPDAEFAERLDEFLDVDEFARFMAVTAWLSNMDSLLAMGQNFLVYLHPKSRQFQFIPWDLDRSFGNFPMIVSGGGTALSIEHPWSEGRFLDRVFGVPEFRRLYRAHLEDFNRTFCRPERIASQVDQLAPALRGAIGEESATALARFERAVAGERDAGGPPRGPAGAPDGLPPGPPGFGEGFGFPPGMPPGPGGGPGAPGLPIKAFALERSRAVARQLSGDLSGAVVPRAGGPGPGGPPGDPGDGFARFLAATLFAALDADGDGTVTAAELASAAGHWFDAWQPRGQDTLTLDQLAAGIERDVVPRPGRPPSDR